MVNKKGACLSIVLQYLLVVVLLFLVLISYMVPRTIRSKPTDGFSQENQDEHERTHAGEVKFNKEYFKEFITDTEDILTSPSLSA